MIAYKVVKKPWGSENYTSMFARELSTNLEVEYKIGEKTLPKENCGPLFCNEDLSEAKSWYLGNGPEILTILECDVVPSTFPWMFFQRFELENHSYKELLKFADEKSKASRFKDTTLYCVEVTPIRELPEWEIDSIYPK